MVCYARPASLLAAVVVVAWLVFSGPLSHFFSTAAVMVAVLVATASAAVAAVVAFATFMSTRRRRAGAGGCVSCRFQCQHAMTEQTSGRTAHAGQGGVAATRSVPVLLPMPAVRVPATSAPHWPDRPIHGRQGARVQSERAAACSVSS